MIVDIGAEILAYDLETHDSVIDETAVAGPVTKLGATRGEPLDELATVEAMLVKGCAVFQAGRGR